MVGFAADASKFFWFMFIFGLTLALFTAFGMMVRRPAAPLPLAAALAPAPPLGGPAALLCAAPASGRGGPVARRALPHPSSPPTPTAHPVPLCHSAST